MILQKEMMVLLLNDDLRDRTFEKRNRMRKTERNQMEMPMMRERESEGKEKRRRMKRQEVSMHSVLCTPHDERYAEYCGFVQSAKISHV